VDSRRTRKDKAMETERDATATVEPEGNELRRGASLPGIVLPETFLNITLVQLSPPLPPSFASINTG